MYKYGHINIVTSMIGVHMVMNKIIENVCCLVYSCVPFICKITNVFGKHTVVTLAIKRNHNV